MGNTLKAAGPRPTARRKLRNHRQFHPGYSDAPTNASALSKAVAEAFDAAPDAMHRAARALRKEV